MKTLLTFAFPFLLFFAFFSCKEDLVDLPDTEIPDPSDTASQRNFKLVFFNMMDQWNRSENLTASITLENSGKPGKQIQLSSAVQCKNQCSTLILKLPKGTYKIQRLIINNESGTTRFATPVAGSSKAAQVETPLSVAMVLGAKIDKEVSLAVLPVAYADSPLSFGYPDGAFGKGSGDPQPAMDKLVYIRPIIKVGEVVYDSIPVQLILKSWDAKGELDYRIHYLKAGTQPVYMPAKAVRFQLSVSKWGSYDEITMTQAEVQENAIYDIGGEVAALKLKSVIEVRIVSGVSKPLTKTDFEYQPGGELKQRLVWGKREDLSTYLMHKDIFGYTGKNITSIHTYDENNTLFKTLSATYNSVGRVTSLQDIKGSARIDVTANYVPLETRTGISQDYRIDAEYRFDNGSATDYYSKTMHGGGVLHDIYATSNGSVEEGTYEYDPGINPYVQLRIPDMFFSQYTKHNLVVSRKTWKGARPLNEAYDIKYIFEIDGYPKEMITKYRSTQSKADTYTIRTIYSYQ